MPKPALSKTRLLPFRIFLCLVQLEPLLCAFGKRFHFDFYLRGQKAGCFFIPDFSLQCAVLCVLILCSHWIGQSLDWDIMYMSAGVWPEIILRMDQAAPRV